MHAVILLLFVHYTVCVCAFGHHPLVLQTNYRVGASWNEPINLSSISTSLHISTRDQDATTQKHTPPSIDISLEAFASSGIHCKSELPHILDTISTVCEEYGMPLKNTNNIIQHQCSELPSTVDSIPGVLGRVLLIKVHGVPVDYDLDENEIFSQLKIDLSERIDMMLSNSEGTEYEASNIKQQNQPILLAFQTDDGNYDDNNTSTAISDAIEKEVLDYSLREGVDDVCQILDDDLSVDSLLTTDIGCFIHPYQFEINCYPQMVIEIDGDMVQSSMHNAATHFDTSSILVFDKLLDKKLRKRLLNVVQGYPESHSEDDDDWNDIDNGPDPKRWVRGGLMDVVPDDNSLQNDNNDRRGSCWGLSDEAIMDICFGDHPAIAEFESKLSQLFPDFVVSRLPEAVLGECVSPLTANAPTHGDTFDYHIDADPYQVPPSPWADVFGRYPNRQKGKPRFVSCLVYLNDEWDAETFGAPTRFLDPPTKETIDVLPKPGRVVIMDQDISHTVVAPNAEAGKRPRYSLVWKLILHPTEENQDMDLSCGRKSLWPEPVVVGSANVNNER